MAERDPAAVEAMFDRLAGRYDLLNTVLSAGADGRWRRRAAAAALPTSGRALDVACGSGKLTVALRRRAGEELVVGLDFSARMLAEAKRRSPGPLYVRGDALRLPFRDGAFDALTIAFGLRNLADPGLGMREMRRVLKPGGVAVVLEFVRPLPGPLGRLYRAYLVHVLPRVGGLISGQPAAYRYLSSTVDTYRTPDQLVEMAADAGWHDVRIELLTFGTVGLLTGRAGGERSRGRAGRGRDA
jgi:demethylmenaquinone methyltransferase/2-methoxy-6-polyprenyl-1,4-benzoquinol methylase